MKAIDALQISRAAIRTSNGAIAVLTKRNSIGEPTVMIVWRDDGSWSTDWLLKKVTGDDWEPLVERLWAGDDIEELEAENANLRKECDKLKAEAMAAAYLKSTTPQQPDLNDEAASKEADVLDKQDGRRDFYDRYYVQGYYCGNCDAGNTRYVRKGVKVTSVPVTCEKCGCEIQVRRQTLLLRLPEVDELAKFYGGLREEKGGQR